ncbi:MAG: B12-binding domain-containing radical SAM protein [Patescibacteria group bacterium]
MADIVLVQPVVGLLDNIKTAPGLPLSLLSAAKLVSKEFKVKIIDQRLDFAWRETLKKELKKKPLLVGTTAMLGPQVEFARMVGEEAKKINPEIPVVWGGPHPSVLPEQTLQDETVDIIVEGDGEETFLKLARGLKKKKSLKAIPGLYFKKGNKVIYTRQAPLVDLNKMPDIPYELVDVYQYLPRRGKVTALDMETSRGCPYRCRFCYNPFFNRGRWRALKAEIVLARIRKIVEKYKIKGIWFIDDEFFIDLKRAREIIEGLIELNLHWTIQGVTANSVLRMDDSFLSLLEKSGCEQLNIGAESGSLRILKMVEKGITPQDILRVNRKLKPYKIMPWFYFMIGFPQETKTDVHKTINLVLRLLKENPRAKVSGIGCFTPYPGTSLFEEAKKEGFVPPKDLLGWRTFSVDQINVPWLKGEKKAMVEAVQFASFFVDEKARDVASSLLVRLIAELYRPIAHWRLKRKFWGLPFDVMIGNRIKKELAKRRISVF